MKTYQTSSATAQVFAQKLQSGHYQGVAVIIHDARERRRETRHVCKQVRADPVTALADAHAFIDWALPGATEDSGAHVVRRSSSIQ